MTEVVIREIGDHPTNLPPTWPYSVGIDTMGLCAHYSLDKVKIEGIANILYAAPGSRWLVEGHYGRTCRQDVSRVHYELRLACWDE